MEAKKLMAQPEVMLRFKCDVHPWMSGWLGILPHPFFAVTTEAGTYSLTNLPALLKSMTSGNQAVKTLIRVHE